VKFCGECGARLEAMCPICAAGNPPANKFCHQCGGTLDTAPVQSPSTSPESYTPKHLAEKILASRATLEGERKQVTVLFADLKGSMELLADRDPEEARTLLDPVLEHMMEAVHRYEGTVNQVLGDGIMAIFGAPVAHEDHALRACYASLGMQDEMHRYRQNLGQTDEAGLQISVGMNTGDVVVRSIDNDLNMDYSALGQTTHLAARMQEIARGNGIILTAATLREVEGFVDVKPLGGVQVKGVSHLVEANELIGVTSAHTRVQASVARGLTPFVGRKSEIEVFQKLLVQAVAGRGQVLAMVGEPGVGKSRLVYEFTHSSLPVGLSVFEGESASYGKATPYFPLIALLRRYFAIDDRDGAETIQDRVVTRTLALDPVLKDTIPPVLSLLNVPFNEQHITSAFAESWRTQWPDIVASAKRYADMEPQQRRRNTLEMLKRIFIRESHRQPVLAIFGPGGKSGKHVHSHSREEFAFVVKGRVTLTLGDEESELVPGDAVTLPAHSPHRWENRGNETVEVLMISSRAQG
jgi:class 3 adenylate cyclase/quercetin dioxygenase-like cupin family protein